MVRENRETKYMYVETQKLDFIDSWDIVELWLKQIKFYR